GAFTVTDTALEVDPARVAGLVGVNTAVSECVPDPIWVAEAVVVAVPPVTGTGAPRLVVSERNCTEPATVAVGVTVAVSVVLAGGFSVVRLEVSVVVELAAAGAWKLIVVPVTVKVPSSCAVAALNGSGWQTSENW